MMEDYKQLVENKRQAMLDALLESIEKNPGKWESGWYAIDVPYNATTGKNYNGLNALFLDATAQLRGYKDTRWVTFNQAKELGTSIKAGEKASDVFYWSRYDKNTKKPFETETVEGMTDEERAEYIHKNVRAVLKFYQVFNAEQCKNFPENTKRNAVSNEQKEQQNIRIETVIKNSAAPIAYDGKNRAYYSPSSDSIHLPLIDSFKTLQDYYATALHEIGHSTGHQSRLNRDLMGFFGSESYAIEELRAELASVFIQSELDINLGNAEIANHGAYLQAWLAVVKKDVNVFYRAAADAGKISDYIKDNYLKVSKERIQEENQSKQAEQVQQVEQVRQSEKSMEQSQFLEYELKALNIVLNSNDGAVGEYISFEGFNHLFNTQQLITKYGGKIDDGQIVITPELQNSYDKLHTEIENKEHKENPLGQVQQVEQVSVSEKPLVVNLFAGPGAGKTTAALELTAALKKAGYNVEYVSEYAKELVLEKKADLLQDQQHVTDTQYQRLERLRNSGVEIVVTDSPVLLGKIYGEGRIDEAYSRQIEGYYKSFENFNLYVQRGATYQTEGRLQTQSEAQALDKKITSMLKEQGVFYGVYDKENVGKTVDRIGKTFNRLFRKENTKEKSQQVGQVQQVQQVEIILPFDSKMNEYGKATMFRMPKGSEYSSFVFLAPTRLVQDDEKNVRLVVSPNFEFTLKNDGRELKLTGEEMRTVLDGKEIGKSAQRTAPSKRNVERLKALKNNVPGEMKEMPNWCVYRTKWNDEKGKKDKFVLSAHDGKWAKINDRNTWADFDTAYKYALENNCEGLAFALDGSGITCIDLDKCIVKDGQVNGVATSKANGEMNDVASKLVPELSDVYCEKSASGNGLHFFLKDDILSKDAYANRAVLPCGDEIEVYDNARFISMTGDIFDKSNNADKLSKLSKCPVQSMNWIRWALGTKNKTNTSPHSSERKSTDLRYQSDSEVLDRIRHSRKGEQFDTLYNGGDITGDKSRDDLAMLNVLAFFTDCNEQQMRSIFEGSGRFRPETKNAAYLTRSIRKACDSLTVRFGQNQSCAKSSKGKK